MSEVTLVMPGAAADLGARQPRAIHSALTVLEAVAELGPGATAREISTALGLPRATAYRLLNLLVQDEFLVRTPDLTGFALGAKVVHLASAAAPVRLPTAARQLLTEVRRSVRGGVQVVMYTDARISVVDSDPDFPFSDPVRLGREPHRYALGRLLLAEQAETASVLSADTIADVAKFAAARQMNELISGYGCLAVGLRDERGFLAGALGFSGPVHRISDPESVLASLRPAAKRLAPLVS